MQFWQYLKHKNKDLQTLTEGLAARFAELMGRGHSVADLMSHYGEEFGHLPAERLRQLAREHRAWHVWRRRCRQIQQARNKASLPELPSSVLQRALWPDQLDAVARAARLSNPQEAGGPAVWEAMLSAGLDLWCAAVGVARKNGRALCQAKDADNPANVHFDAYLQTRHELDGIAPHRWLALRRGCRQGVLTLTLELPRAELVEQCELLRSRLAVGFSAGRSTEVLLEELVLDDLDAWLLTILDGEAEAQAIASACASLQGLLQAPALQARRVGALFGGANKAVAVVVADREGELVGQRVLKPEGEWLAKALELFEQHKVHHVVLPTATSVGDPIACAEPQIVGSGLQIQRVRAAALAEARQPLTDPPQRLTGLVASALVLARRAIDPVKAWSSVDPVSIGVAEYQNDLDEDRLRAALAETVEICRLARRRGKATAPAGGVSRGGGAVARLNPLVRSVGDLRAGMKVHGVVTNVSHFGAFISLGLPQEALVHISELSDDYIANPNEVVTIGQQVTAHVLSVDRARGRISLSMKSHRPAVSSPRRATETTAAGGTAAAAKARPRTRAEALASLERLFKK